MLRLFIHLLLFSSIFAKANRPFILIIIDTEIKQFVYITSDTPVGSTIVRGYAIDLGLYGKRMNEICDRFEQKPADEDWIAEMWIDKLRADGTLIKRLQAVYACVDRVQPKNKLLPKIVRKLTNKFERHMPKHWAKIEGFNKFNCSDIYGRPIPMPVGIRRCYVQQTRKYDPRSNDSPIVKAEYGTDRRPKNHIFKEKECEISISWQPFKSLNDKKYIGDGECVIGMSLMEMSFFCCCYTNSTQCDIANVHHDGLNCPKLLNFTSYIDIADTRKPIENTPLKEGTVIKASELELTPNCYTKMSFEAKHIGTVIEYSLTITDKDDNMCKDMFKKRTRGKPCAHLERLCVTDVDPALVFCCHFKSSDVNENEQTILAVHKQAYELFSREAPVSLYRLGQCLRPWGDAKSTNDDGCVYFYDPEMKKFVNIQRENFDLRPDLHEKMISFIKTDVENLASQQFYGRYKTDDPRTFGCLKKKEEWQTPNNTAFPLWYEFAVIVFKCVNAPNALYRCDDFNTDQVDFIDTLDGYLDPKYVCNNGETVTTPFAPTNKHKRYSHDAFCLEYVMLNNDDSSVLVSLPRNEMLAPYRVWHTKKQEKDDGHDKFFCGITKDGKSRFCACTANKDIGCNTGKYVQTFNHIAKQEQFTTMTNYTLDNGSDRRVCSLPRLDNTADKCLEIMEENSEMLCYFLLYEKKTKADIACLREPNLSQRRPERHMKSKYGWHNYQLCSTVEIPNDPGYKCVLKDNHFDNYVDPVIVCCCKSDTCTEAYQDLLKQGHWKETHDFVD
uniref:Glycoprotein n=1 Tax=Panagrellus redivivus TaxID=6233 RepID=A0A7E4VGT3_PANRE